MVICSRGKVKNSPLFQHTLFEGPVSSAHCELLCVSFCFQRRISVLQALLITQSRLHGSYLRNPPQQRQWVRAQRCKFSPCYFVFPVFLFFFLLHVGTKRKKVRNRKKQIWGKGCSAKNLLLSCFLGLLGKKNPLLRRPKENQKRLFGIVCARELIMDCRRITIECGGVLRSSMCSKIQRGASHTYLFFRSLSSSTQFSLNGLFNAFGSTPTFSLCCVQKRGLNGALFSWFFSWTTSKWSKEGGSLCQIFIKEAKI